MLFFSCLLFQCRPKTRYVHTRQNSCCALSLFCCFLSGFVLCNASRACARVLDALIGNAIYATRLYLVVSTRQNDNKTHKFTRWTKQALYRGS